MSAEDDDDSGLIDFYPYRARFKTYECLEPEGRDRESILSELATMAHEEDRIADLGRVSEFGWLDGLRTRGSQGQVDRT